MTIATLSAGASTTYSILHSFHDGTLPNDGMNPASTSLIQGTDGNFYGVTASGGGGMGASGTVYMMTPTGSITIVHRFPDVTVKGGSDGTDPQAAVTEGPDGAFYGTCFYGGGGSGVAFRVTSTGGYSILHFFGSTSNDGGNPAAPLTLAPDGNFYGTTTQGGKYGKGTVFKMTPSGTVTILHSFGIGSDFNNNFVTDGSWPVGQLVLALDGNLYGTTSGGGNGGGGTVYRVSTTGTFSVVHSFDDGTIADDGTGPAAGLVLSPTGEMYGTTEWGGNGTVGFGGVPSTNPGVVFKVTTDGTLTILHRFHDPTVANDGINPLSNLVFGTDGNIYGVTWTGGADSQGVVFQMTPAGTMTILHSFSDGSVTNDGENGDGLIQAADGSFYGTTGYGGTPPFRTGIVFRMTVPSPPVTTASVAGTLGNNGWYTSTATVTLSATDPNGLATTTYYSLDSGPTQTYSSPFSISGDGIHGVAFWSVDADGNTEAKKFTGAKIDTTPPTATFGLPSPAANAAGWNNGTVTIGYTTSDATSGVASASPDAVILTPSGTLTFSAEGAGQTKSVTVTDFAGNSATYTSPAVNIDLTPPSTTASLAPARHGSTITLSSTDNLSGVATTYYTLDGGPQQTYSGPFTIGFGSDTVTYWSVDVAGNIEAAHTLTVDVPKLASLDVSTSRLVGGQKTLVTVTLDGPAPQGGTRVYVSTDNAAASFKGPFITVPAGATSAVATLRTSTVAKSVLVTISADAGTQRSKHLRIAPTSTATI